MKKILLIFGGEGSENEVSIMSARNVYQAIDSNEYDVSLGYIGRSGKLVHVDSIDDVASDDDQRGSELVAQLGKKGFFRIIGPDKYSKSSNTDKATCLKFDLYPDAIFPLIHGRGGEDGSLAALGQLLHIPVVGCGVTPSTIAWDKDLCKQILRANGIPVVPWLAIRKSGDIDFDTATEKLKSNILFVKPAREGSSVGVSRVAKKGEFDTAIKNALHYDDKVLIEPAVKGRELECAVLFDDKDIKTTTVGEIVYGSTQFYDYDAKYSEQSSAKTVIPASSVPDLVIKEIQKYAKQAFTAIGGNGLSRIDFFYSDAGEIYINEINTMPGFTNISMYPKLWQHEGVSYPQLVTKLIEIAIDSSDTSE